MKIGNVEEMLSDFSNGLYDFTKNDKCSGCGACCSDLLPITNKEINQIHRYIKKHNIKRQSHGVFALAKPGYDMVCPFMDDSKRNHKCTIYEVRPMICRDFICKKGNMPSPELVRADINIVSMTKTFFKEDEQ